MRRAVGLVLVGLAVAAASAAPARATDFVVTKTADTNDGSCAVNDCSLRDAIVAANANAGADRIVLGSGLTYTLSLGPPDADGTIAEGSGDLDITGELTIDGHGSTIDGGGIDRVLDIQGAFPVTLNDVTIQHGLAAGTLSLGGGIRILGATVVLNNCTVTLNDSAADPGSDDPGGGIAVIGSYDAATAIATLAGLTLANSRILNNTGSNGGGIACVLCTLTVTGSAVDANIASGTGGGVMVVGDASSLSIAGSDVAGNSSGIDGGGVSVPFGAGTGTIDRSRIAANTAPAGSAIANAIATMTATNDWWGCNFGPGAGGSGCAGTANGVSGAATVAPFLVLSASAAPLTTVISGTSTATADLTFNSANVDTSAGGTLRDGTSVAFSSTHGAFATASSGTVAGKATDVFTASTPGTASLTAGLDGQTASVSVDVVCQAISISPATLPVALPNVAYGPVTLFQAGAIGTATFTVTAGAPPAGINLSSAGVLSGTPTVVGPATFTVTVTDSNGCTGTRTFTLTVGCPTITVAPSTLPRAIDILPYNALLTATGGRAPITFTRVPSPFPSGLTMSGGAITGTPISLGSFDFTVRVRDADGCGPDVPFNISVSRGAVTWIGLGPTTGFEPPRVTGFGPTGMLIGVLYPEPLSFLGGIRVATGDVNGDGRPDIITGTGPGGAPMVRVFDGQTGLPIVQFNPFDPSFTGGVYVAAGDINGDGRADVLVGSGPGSVPIVRVFDGVTGTLLRSFNPYVLAFTGGVRVAAGDVTGDGFADIITAAGPGGTPHVEVFDGATNALLASFFAYTPGFGGGVYVAAGDVNGDGFADVVTGAGPGGGPHVQVLDLHNGTTLASFYAYTPGFGGGVRVAAADIDRDGHADVLTGPGGGGGPHVRVWSGATGSEMLGWFAYDPAFTGGVFVAAPVTVNRMSIDVPAANATVNGSFFTLAGWALQEWSPTDPGIATIHIWTFPVGGGSPVFLGVATLGDARPDVAAAFGGEHLTSGYHLDVSGLAPGVYDVVVFVQGSASHTFNDRRVVRITVQ